MQTLRLLIYSILLATSLVVGAAEVSTRAGAEFQTLLAKKVFALDRPLTTFRYESHPVEFTTPAGLKQHVFVRTQNFYDVSVDSGDMAGPGMYVAMDPAATRSEYGGLQPHLFVITFKTGTKIFDLRSEFMGEDAATYKRLAAELHCSQPGYDTPTLIQLRNNESKLCRDTLIHALHSLRVQALLYDYYASGTISECGPSRDIALNVIASEGIDAGKLNYYSDSARLESDQSMGPFIRELFNEAALDPKLSKLQGTVPIVQSLLTLPAVSAESYSAWKSANIWKCGSPRSHENL